LQSAGKLYAQNTVGRIDSLATTLNERNELSGNIFVAADGKIVYKHSFGYADVANKILNSDSSVFILASLSKPFTAIAILQLKENGKLKLDDAVTKYLPDFPYNTVTIRQLLSHTSGLTDLQIFEGPYRADTNKIFSNADIIPAIRADKNALIAQPGEKYSYSNTGFGILVLIVEKITGMLFQDYLRKRIFAPAKMNHTYIRSRLIDQNPGDRNRTKNYDFLSYAPGRLLVADSMKKHKIELVNLSGILGPDAVVSTTGDLLRFDQALYGSKLLRQSTLKEAFTPGKLNNGQDAMGGWGKIAWYSGLGWMILRDTTNGKIVFHPGGDAGAVTILLRNLTRNQTVVILDNVTHRGVHGTGVDILNLLNNRAIISDKQSLAKIYANCLFEKGTDYATIRFNELKNDTTHYYMDERELNNLGYDLLNDSHHTEGVEVLRLNTILFPNSWNAYDSYAEALLLVGKKEEAIAMYQLSIKMNPGNLGEKKMLEKLEEKQ
jgi:CubicO group peptidase (beta-lactamase class C family)